MEDEDAVAEDREKTRKAERDLGRRLYLDLVHGKFHQELPHEDDR